MRILPIYVTKLQHKMSIKWSFFEVIAIVGCEDSYLHIEINILNEPIVNYNLQEKYEKNIDINFFSTFCFSSFVN